MRLIDADALIMQMNDGPYNCPGDCGVCDTDEIIIDGRKLIACSAVTHTPTIPAIPVEWMRDKMRGYASALKSTETAALVMVMQMWQKEQEAQDEPKV